MKLPLHSLGTRVLKLNKAFLLGLIEKNLLCYPEYLVNLDRSSIHLKTTLVLHQLSFLFKHQVFLTISALVKLLTLFLMISHLCMKKYLSFLSLSSARCLFFRAFSLLATSSVELILIISRVTSFFNKCICCLFLCTKSLTSNPFCR